MGILVADEEGNTCGLEVTLDQPLSTLKALIEADLKVPAAEQVLLKDGQPVRDEATAAIGTLNIKDGDMLYVVRDRTRASGQGGPGGKYRSLADVNLANPEVYIKELLEHPRLLKELEFHDPELAAAVKEQDVVKCRTVQMKRRLQSTKARMDKQKEMAALEANPFDVEAQRKIEEMLRLENVQKNMEVAMEEMPESFGRVIMLYVDAEVNGVPIKAFVDSGAQSTIMSVACAERCGLMRLIDTRFAGVAQGVGTCKILGRVHIAQLKVGRSFYPCTFTVLEKNDMDFLFGLDMLKRHQCVIDLKRGVLQLGTAGDSVPFLGEADLPKAARGTYEGEEATPMDDSKPPAVTGAQASGAGHGGQVSSTSPAVAASGGNANPDLAQLIDMGFPADQAAIALQNAGGNVGLAAQILSEQFGF